jgi:hypothetical protein
MGLGPRSVCVRSFVKHSGCCATDTDHAKARVDSPFCILPPEDHTPSETSNAGRVQRLRDKQRSGVTFTTDEVIFVYSRFIVQNSESGFTRPEGFGLAAP